MLTNSESSESLSDDLYQAEDDLYEAILNGDLESAKCAIGQGVDIINGGDTDYYYCHRSAQTPLHFAIRHRQLEILKLLIRAGADTTLVEGLSGKTPLQYACEFGNLDAVKCFIENEVNLNTFGWNNNTALHSCINMNRVEAINLLIEAGADIWAKNYEGEEALESAFKYVLEDDNKVAMAKLLMKAIIRNDPDAEKPNFDIEVIFDQSDSDEDEDEVRQNKYSRLKYFDSYFSEFWNNCKSEIKQMKNERIDGSTYTYFDLLSIKDESKRAAMFNSEIIKRNLELINLTEKFPNFHEAVSINREKGIKRIELEKLSEGLEIEIKGHRLHDKDCINKIKNYLNSKTLQEQLEPKGEKISFFQPPIKTATKENLRKRVLQQVTSDDTQFEEKASSSSAELAYFSLCKKAKLEAKPETELHCYIP